VRRAGRLARRGWRRTRSCFGLRGKVQERVLFAACFLQQWRAFSLSRVNGGTGGGCKADWKVDDQLRLPRGWQPRPPFSRTLCPPTSWLGDNYSENLLNCNTSGSRCSMRPCSSLRDIQTNPIDPRGAVPA